MSLPAGRAPVVVIAALTAIALAAPARISSAGATATLDHGRVTRVVDGDTFDVDLDGDSRADRRVRMLGVDTPEKGWCGFHGARRALARLIDGRRVELRSDAGRTGQFDRILRGARVWRNGRWIDASRWMLRGGYGLWMSQRGELRRALGDHRASAKAAAGSRRYFDPVRCRRGPRQGVSLQVDVQWRQEYVPGVDPLYEEFVRVTNTGGRGIDVSGWTIRTGSQRNMSIPSGKPIAPGRTLTVHVGSGKDRRYHRFLDRRGPILSNPDLDDNDPHVGNGIYILDLDGDTRAYQMWPCVRDCTDPTLGAFVIDEVNYDAPGIDADNPNGEWVRFVNTGSTWLHTGRLVFEMQPYIYELPPRHKLKPGGTLTIRVGHGTDTHDVRYLGSDEPILRNDGKRVLVRTFDAIIIDCVAWGDWSCPGVA